MLFPRNSNESDFYPTCILRPRRTLVVGGEVSCIYPSYQFSSFSAGHLLSA